jgi:iron complex outermembrane recepter protein
VQHRVAPRHIDITTKGLDLKHTTNTGLARKSLLGVSSVSLMVSALCAQAQQAPATEAVDDVETVVVTGSRIQRRDYEANSPIVSVDDSLLKNSGTAAIETNLAKLPQFHAVQTPAQGGDIQPTATNTPGAATISLRGLGANRNLILLDGRRATPGNASQVVDINTIPSMAIERVETITGGASATYGADAVGGVVNFILRKKFEGLQVDAQYGISERGDGEEYQVGGVLGANLDGGRGNVMLAFQINDRKSALHIDRPWFDKLNKSATTYGNDREFFPDFSGYDPLFNFPSQAVIDTLFTPGSVTAGGAGGQFRYYFNNDGSPFLGFFQSYDTTGGGVAKFKGDLTSGKWVKTTDGQLKQSFQDALAVLPLHRDNFLTRGSYEINDWLSFTGQGMFSRVTTNTVQQPSPSVNGWGATIPYDNRAIPAALKAMLDSRPNNTADWKLVDYLDNVVGNRESRVDVFTYNMQGGLEGKIPGTSWTWEAYASTGQSETSSLLTGVASLERYRAVITAPNWGQGFSLQGNPSAGGFGASTATCTSGLNPFNPSLVVSQDCKEAISADLKGRAVLKQDVQEVNLQGALFDLPAGEVRAAVGASNRESSYEFLNDTLTTQGRSFNDQSIGIYPSGNSRGTIRVKEVYAEALVPVLSDLPFAQKLELELGIRASDYSTTGSSTTWKALASWQPVDFMRVRGGFNRAERSPNIAELYLAPQQTFVYNASGDLCSFKNGSPFSANPANANATQVLALCRALMDKFPGTANAFYANASYYNSQGGTFAFPTLQGNPNVKPEQANTWTLGAAFTSPFEAEVLQNLRLSVDYYSVQVKDALGAQSVDIAQRQCFDPAFNPTFSVSSPYCAGINRVANDGALGNIITTFFNNGRFVTEGVDTQIDWAYDVGPGRLSVNSLFTYLISLKSSELASDPMLEYAGTLGPNQNGINPGNFRWKMFNTFSYSLGAWTGSLQWQHLPSIKSAEYALFSGNTTIQGAGSYDQFGFSGSYAVGKNLTVRFGIDNLLDKAPPVAGVNSSPPPGVLAGGAINDVLYDVNGRRFYLGASISL